MNYVHIHRHTVYLLVPRIKNHLSSFELGFLNIISRQNLLRSLSHVLFLLQRYKYGAKECPKTTFYSTFEMTLPNQKTAKTIGKPLKEIPWNQQLLVPLACSKFLGTYNDFQFN